MIYPVILCGGSGTRLWPLSRQSYPKQFAKLTGETSLFQNAALRCKAREFAAPLVITADPFRFIVLEQLASIEMSPLEILIEPAARNTAAAIIASALALEKRDPDAVLLILPSDHDIPDTVAFRDAVRSALPEAVAGKLVTFGIQPDRAETGYGYLRLTASGSASGAPQALAAFVEKPDEERAAAMVADGMHLWNAGIFLFSVRAIVEAFSQYATDTLEKARAALAQGKTDLGFTRLSPKPWADMPDVSIDYAIMEKAKNLVVMPFHGRWSDLGGWEAVWSLAGPDDRGNVVSDQSLALECSDTMLRSEVDGLQLVGIGLENIVAIAMPDAVLVARKDQTQKVKEAVAVLKSKFVRQATEFSRDFRPWGWYESLALGARFQVKRIVVKPGAALSLQSHHHRAEHWIVVEGTARVTVNDDVRLISENQSVFIPLGAIHRLENPGKLPMVLIEVQTGSYLGEDDIIRYEDIYART